MIERYTRKEIKNIWDDYNRYSIWLNIELAAAEAMEKFKIIPYFWKVFWLRSSTDRIRVS